MIWRKMAEEVHGRISDPRRALYSESEWIEDKAGGGGRGRIKNHLRMAEIM